jgi:hypothetical protein
VVFHNFAHATNVLHCASIIWNKIDNAKYFDSVDLLAIFVGCISHDLDHFGLGNSYFVKTGHPLAQAVNNQSVMENYHIHMAFNLINKHDLFHALSPKEVNRVKRSIVEMVIPTDLSKHFGIID